MMRWRLSLLLIIIVSLFGSRVLAVGLSVKPKEIRLLAKTGQVSESEFLVMNIEDQPALYRIYADSLVANINLAPTEFTLAAGENQTVKLSAMFKNPGTFSTNISIVARPLGASGLVAASGVKLSVMAEVYGLAVWLKIVFIILAVCFPVSFGVTLIIYLKKLRRIK